MDADPGPADPGPVAESTDRVAGLLLAAGSGRRYGGPKALVSFQGRPLVLRSRDVLVAAGCAPVLVVVGAQAEAVTALVGSGAIRNPAWPTGMGSSLRAGLAALEVTAVTAVVVVLVDMPGVGAEAVRRLAAVARPDVLAVAGYHGNRWGHPVLLGREHWTGAAASARRDRGARDYLRQHRGLVRVVPCADVADATDLDVPPMIPALTIHGFGDGQRDDRRASLSRRREPPQPTSAR